MSEMIERIAKAMIDEISTQNIGGIYVGGDDDDSPLTPVMIDGEVDFGRVARAVIAAMREPTADMIEAGFNAPKGPLQIIGYRAESAWVAMIDRALETAD